MQHADGRVGAEVALLGQVGGPGGVALGVGGVPRAVGVLVAGEPVVGGGGAFVLARGVQGHGGLDVVPGVEVVAAEPGDGAVGALDGGDARGGGGGLGRGEDAGQDEAPGAFRAGHAAAVRGLVA